VPIGDVVQYGAGDVHGEANLAFGTYDAVCGRGDYGGRDVDGDELAVGREPADLVGR
jgi:hypothetical protein